LAKTAKTLHGCYGVLFWPKQNSFITVSKLFYFSLISLYTLERLQSVLMNERKCQAQPLQVLLSRYFSCTGRESQNAPLFRGRWNRETWQDSTRSNSTIDYIVLMSTPIVERFRKRVPAGRSSYRKAAWSFLV